jgi:hypothetical protein
MTARALLVAKPASHAGAQRGGTASALLSARVAGKWRVTVGYRATSEGETVAWRVLPRRCR